jgi:4-hydroxy-2-oxoglutarate aldolase
MSTQPAFAGIYPPIATPFNEDGEISVAGLKANVARWNDSQLTGLIVLGSNGEFPYIDDDERDLIISTVVESAREGLRIIVGTGHESTRATIRATRRAADLGAHAAIVVHPSYYTGRMTDTVLYEHYRAVAEASPLPVLMYNVPGFTGVNMSAALVARLAQVPNLAGIKDTSGNIVQIADIVRQTPPTFTTLAGSASFLLASLAVGAQGGILALANLAPDECVQMAELFHAGRLEEARALQHRILPTNAAITSRYGAAGLKHAMALRGYYGGLPRPPLLPLTEAEKADVERILREAQLL